MPPLRWRRAPARSPTRACPRKLAEVGGTLFFTADDGIHGRELWKSDGTAAGTVLVKDISPGSRTTPDPASLTVMRRHAVLHRRRRHPRRGSCGSPTAPPPAPSWSRTSTPSTGYDAARARLLDRRRQNAVLHRRRRHPRHGAVEVRRHRGRHRPGQGHQTRRRRSPAASAPIPDRCGREVVLHRRRRRRRPSSCGSPTAPRPAPSWSRTSAPPTLRLRRRSYRPVQRTSTAAWAGQTSVLRRRRRQPRPGAVEVATAPTGGHRAGRGHRPRRRNSAPPPS